LILGILEFNPQLAGQDITPANLEFGSMTARRRDRREKSFSGVSVLQGSCFLKDNEFVFLLSSSFIVGNQPSFNAVHGTSFTGATDESIPLVGDKKNKEIYFLFNQFFLLDKYITNT